MQKLAIPFRNIADKLFEYVCLSYLPNERFPYPLQRGQNGTLLGTVFACYIANMLGRVNDLPGRQHIVEMISSLRDPDSGLYVDPDVEPHHYLNTENHSEHYVKLQTTYFCHVCLHALGVDSDFRVPWVLTILDNSEVGSLLESLDWDNPWLVSNIDMFIGVFLLEWRDYCQTDNQIIKDLINSYFNWHNKTQNHDTGYWGSHGDLLNAMAGAYHIYVNYDYNNISINHADRIIDATLSLVTRDGLFVYGGGGGSCEDMDAIDILVRTSLLTDHKDNYLKNILLNAALMLYSGQVNDGGFSWRVQPRIKNFFTKSVGRDFKLGTLYDLLYKSIHRSHYVATHNYSSLTLYPFKIDESDMWSGWFRPLALAFVARRYPESFTEPCDWKLPSWPGLGFNPFI